MAATDRAPVPGEIARVRARRYVVEQVVLTLLPDDWIRVRLPCLEGEPEGAVWLGSDRPCWTSRNQATCLLRVVPIRDSLSHAGLERE